MLQQLHLVTRISRSFGSATVAAFHKLCAGTSPVCPAVQPEHPSHAISGGHTLPIDRIARTPTARIVQCPPPTSVLLRECTRPVLHVAASPTTRVVSSVMRTRKLRPNRLARLPSPSESCRAVLLAGTRAFDSTSEPVVHARSKGLIVLLKRKEKENYGRSENPPYINFGTRLVQACTRLRAREVCACSHTHTHTRVTAQDQAHWCKPEEESASSCTQPVHPSCCIWAAGQGSTHSTAGYTLPGFLKHSSSVLPSFQALQPVQPGHSSSMTPASSGSTPSTLCFVLRTGPLGSHNHNQVCIGN